MAEGRPLSAEWSCSQRDAHIPDFGRARPLGLIYVANLSKITTNVYIPHMSRLYLSMMELVVHTCR